MERPPDFGAFSHVDDADAAALGGYLDAVGSEDAVARWKALSFDLLEAGPGAVVVDVGCGLGDDVRALALRTAPAGRAIGVDMSESMIAEARRRSEGATGPAGEFHVADAASLPLGDAVADGCRCERLLQHVEEPAAVVREMARVIRPGGIVLAAEPDWGTLVVDGGDPELESALGAVAMARVRSPAVGRSLRRLLSEAGLVEVEVLARTLVLTDLPRAEMLLGIDALVERAVADGVVPPARAEAWRAGLQATAAAGRLTAAVTSFLALGRAG
ncbi:MAG TPA: methyltransferase domain-containing protein [Miltoncostaeaceae bacterium]|nr:methyltransferase domain-containing protein [Miltoncostaeaceae bacterium]